MNFASITDYLEYIFDEFNAEISGMDTLCDLRNVSFESGNLPDYNNRAQALLYCLRYHFGYAFEYDYMFREDILPLYKEYLINILSVGCGNGIDYWAIRHAADRRPQSLLQVNYIGIDCVNWDEKMESTGKDSVEYHHSYVKESKAILDNIPRIDVLFFPKSISELDRTDLSYLADLIQEKNNIICLAASFRNNKPEDVAKFDFLVECFERYGFSVYNGQKNMLYQFENNAGIRSYYNEYIYPDEAKDFLANLNGFCNERDESDNICAYECDGALSRTPILTNSQVCFNFVIFSRRSK